jgi:hypothetical protein
MSFLKNLFGHKEAPAASEAPAPIACQHVSLLPRWDSVEDMGKEDRAAYFVCEACGERFDPAAARKLTGDLGIEQFKRPA